MTESTSLLPWQARVVVEKAELDERISKLRQFLAGDHFDTVNNASKSQLEKQLHHMVNYSSVLGDRIREFDAAGS